jgi:predicted transporter
MVDIILITLTLAIAVIFFLFYILWIFYLAVMNLKRVRDSQGLHPFVRVLGMPILIVGWVLDTVLNWVVMTVVLLEFPRETTISARLKRHNRYGTGFRKKIAQKFEILLDSFDPSGDHI